MASYFASYTCEYNQRSESIFCCTYVDEYICQTEVVEGKWRFCPYCGEQMNILTSALNLPLPPSPPPEPETITLEELEKSFGVSSLAKQEPIYVPPPRIKAAEEMWPFMVCKMIVKKLFWPFGTVINYRSHYALLTLLANRYYTTVDELVKINPITLLGDSKNARMILGPLYVKLEAKAHYDKIREGYTQIGK